MKKNLLFVFLVIALFASSAFGATTYRYGDSVSTIRGDVIGGATITVYTANTTTKPTLYRYNTDSIELTNPTYTDTYGRFFFYVAPGLYDVVVSGTGLTSYTIEDIRVWSDSPSSGKYNVIDYGAIPDDGLDDSVGIQAAIDACEGAFGGTVYFPTGTYLYDNVTVDGDNVSIECSGAVFMYPSVAGTSGTPAYMLHITGDNFKITGAQFIMTAQSGTYDYAVYANGSSGVKILDCYCTGGGYAFATRASSQVVMDNCEATGFREYGFLCWGDSEDISITNCSAHDTIGSVTANGIKIAGTTTGTATQIDGVVISDNRTWNCIHGIDVAINSGSNYTISDNVIWDCTGYALVFKFNTFTYLGGESGISGAVISGNSIFSEALGMDIQREGGQPTMSGVTVTGNTILWSSVRSSGSHQGLRVYGVDDSLFSGNLISGWRRGVLLADSNRNIVSDNTVIECYKPIEVSTQIDSLSCSGNIIKGNTVKAATSDDFSQDSSAINIVDAAADGGPIGTVLMRNVLSVEGSDPLVSDAGSGTIEMVHRGTSGIYEGSGSPEGAVSATNGSAYHRSDGGSGSSFYIKESSAEPDSGWSAVKTSSEVHTSPWTMPSAGAGSVALGVGTYYVAGFYEFGATPANFSGAPVNFGNVNESKAAHFMMVAADAASDTTTEITIIGTTINDSGVRQAPDTSVVRLNNAAIDTYYETPEKWLGQVSVEKTAGTDRLVNYGWCKYWDNSNQDFIIHGGEANWFAEASGAFDAQLIHHKSTGWSYNAVGEPSYPTPVFSLDTIHVTEVNTVAGDYGAVKIVGGDIPVDGSGSEGVIGVVIFNVANQINYGQMILMYSSD